MARREKGEPSILFYDGWLTQTHLVLPVVGIQLLLSSGNLFILLQTTEHREPVLKLNPTLSPSRESMQSLCSWFSWHRQCPASPCRLYNLLHLLILWGKVGQPMASYSKMLYNLLYLWPLQPKVGGWPVNVSSLILTFPFNIYFTIIESI